MEHRNINTVGTIFNDFLGLYTGERPVGIHELIQKYDRHPVLMGLLSNVDSVIYVDVKKAMQALYDPDLKVEILNVRVATRLTRDKAQDTEDEKAGISTEYKEAPWPQGVKLKDGTLLTMLYGGPGTSGFVDDTTNTYVASYAFNQVIDVNEIESVLFTKDTINVGEIPTEDNYYCVPLK